MVRLAVLLGSLPGCAPAPSAAEPPVSSPTAASQESPSSAVRAVPELPVGCCVLQIFRPSDGFTFRIWDDGRWTESRDDHPETARSPFDPTLQYDQVRTRFIADQKAAWATALEAEGPASGTLHFATQVDGHIRGRWVDGTLSDATSLTPLTATWLELRRRLYAPRR